MIMYNCFGQNNCENGAYCLQNSANCPQTSICVCPKCFYGTRCKYSSNLFEISLDSILGYYIQLHRSISHQASIVQISVALTTVMIIVGITDSVLPIITFKTKELRKTSCGLYLLSSSIVTLLLMIIFALKFWILIIAQMKNITNELFLYIQCLSIDFLLRIGLNMNQCLNACAAIERAIITIKRANFNQQKNARMAKYIIFILLLIIIVTTIHDPIHRRLLNENDNDLEETRIWRIVIYSINLQKFNLFILMFYFFVPFLINIISALIIIIMTTRKRTIIQKRQHYKNLLSEQCLQHKHLIIAPFPLVLYD
ncbi:unnamed protein product [Rotaria sp. Silwood1]|nr:unnamed protein product [Rotaria sp. Silwood1]CAF5014344.1 unnamed protein product [Rotaria sp. Silwood1]